MFLAFFPQTKPRILLRNFIVQPLSHVPFFATLWTATHLAFLSFTISQSLFRLMPIEFSVYLSNIESVVNFLSFPSTWTRPNLHIVSGTLYHHSIFQNCDFNNLIVIMWPIFIYSADLKKQWQQEPNSFLFPDVCPALNMIPGKW